MKKDLRNHLLFRPMPVNVLTLCTKCHASHADEKGKHFFWASLHVFWTWALLLDLTTILLGMATLLLDLRVLLDLIHPSCSTWPFPKPYPCLHRNFSDSCTLFSQTQKPWTSYPNACAPKKLVSPKPNLTPAALIAVQKHIHIHIQIYIYIIIYI